MFFYWMEERTESMPPTELRAQSITILVDIAVHNGVSTLVMKKDKF